MQQGWGGGPVPQNAWMSGGQHQGSGRGPGPGPGPGPAGFNGGYNGGWGGYPQHGYQQPSVRYA